MSASAELPTPSPAMVARIYRLSVAQYHKMIDHGILTAEDRVELIEGLLIRRLPETAEHDRVLRNTMQTIEIALSRAFGNQAAEHRSSETEPG
jgi:hypothetical protein